MPSLRRFQQFGSELTKQVLRREAAKSECHARVGMAEIVESRRHIKIAHESAGSRPGKVCERNSVVPGIRFVDESEGHRVKASRQWIFAGGWPVAEIFMQDGASQEPASLKRSSGRQGARVISAKRARPHPPIARIRGGRIKHANGGVNWRYK